MYPHSHHLPQLTPPRVWAAGRRLSEAVWTDRQDCAVAGGAVRTAFIDLGVAQTERLHPVHDGEEFGPVGGGWAQRWFRVTLPAADKKSAARRHLFWSCQGESTAWIEGQPWAGLDIAHLYCPLPSRLARSGGELWMDCGTWQTGIFAPGQPIDPRYPVRFHGCWTALRDEAAWQTLIDYEILRDLMNLWLEDAGYKGGPNAGYKTPLTNCPPRLRRLLHRMEQAVDALDHDGVPACAVVLQAVLGEFTNEVTQHQRNHGTTSVVGHSHLDLCYRWPEHASERKAVHTAASMLRLLERYPEFIYTCSQPAQLAMIDRGSAAVGKELRRYMREGRIDFTGAMEVESDVSLTSGEGLIRALQLGQRCFTGVNGKPATVLWLPDVFGYCACLPQILRLAGVTRFFTTKLNWSAVTRFPHSSLRWRAPDGSEVLTHICPTGYDETVKIERLRHALNHHPQAAVHPEVLIPTGYGDGGGGANEEMLERARRLQSLDGIPAVRWSGVEAFFDRLADVADDLPVFQGELYLEYHRGTATTQTRFKSQYRAAERVLLAHEAVRVITGGPALDDEHWRRTVFCQFHDVLPGTSIGKVYASLSPEMLAVVERGRKAMTGELASTGRGYLFTNPLALPRQVLVKVPATWQSARTMEGQILPVQNGLCAVALPSLGMQGLRPSKAQPSAETPTVQATAQLLDNGIVSACFDTEGSLCALQVHGQDLRMISGRLKTYPDYPHAYDAWDIDRQTLSLGQPLPAMTLRVEEQGPVRSVLRGEFSLGGSTFQVDWILEAGSAWLRCELHVNWQERHMLIKFHAQTQWRGRFARFGQPFGAIDRCQVPGLAHEEAQWEVSASRWAAVRNDDGQGLAIVSESAYGFSCRDGDLALSLLRGPTDPDPEADLGQHTLRFALGAHADHSTAEILATAAAAEALYGEVPVSRGDSLHPSLCDWKDLSSLVPSAVVPCDGGYILRLHEVAGTAGKALLRLATLPQSVERVDLMGQVLAKLSCKDHLLEIPFAPWQILSIRICTQTE